MAKASFFVNDITIRKKGEYLVIEARKKCQHGTVFDEIFLTLPGNLEFFFTTIDQNYKSLFTESNDNKSGNLFDRFERFSSDN
jgi:hypothetical protein